VRVEDIGCGEVNREVCVSNWLDLFGGMMLWRWR
jgi:hypothetical protein